MEIEDDAAATAPRRAVVGLGGTGGSESRGTVSSGGTSVSSNPGVSPVPRYSRMYLGTNGETGGDPGRKGPFGGRREASSC